LEKEKRPPLPRGDMGRGGFVYGVTDTVGKVG